MNLSRSARGLRSSVFARLAERMKSLPADHYPLHIGDTWRRPPAPARLERIDWAQVPEIYRYSHPFGLSELLEAVAEKLRRKNGIAAEAEWVQITCGATHALFCAAHTVLDPGDEVLVLAPFWPLIPGVLGAAGARAVQVPCFDRLYRDPALDLRALLEACRTPKTRAIYFSNPNNPDGKVLEPHHLEALAEFCRDRDLWALADEVYEDYLYDGRTHRSLAALPGMAERTVTAFSFSKSYAMAGQRLGYAVGAPEVMRCLRRVCNHSVYNVSASMQYAALQALRHGDSFLEESRRLYDIARRVMVEGLSGRVPVPEGGAYVFLELGSEAAMWDLVHRALDRGVVLAPGEAFGEEYRHCVRICFTALPEEGIRRAAAILRELL